MASARHFFKSQSAEQTRADITADIQNSRQAQRDAAANGQHGLAESMRRAADENLDELNQLDNGTWKPNHA
ncbi:MULTISPECIES: hypothetical protein [unclassified Streptomyces]|uniref:hypothetical protein n=1 Tax=unclassified Streptomyces TaxID=2593676 RepID=UPI00085198C0|nr:MULTISPECIES: hypothetical protein [unclassified Streptomyces]MDQ0694250.1 hypothetical protein [Streptomyces sp. W4I9-2]